MRTLLSAIAVAVLVGLSTVATGSSAPHAAAAEPVFEVPGLAFCTVYYRVERLACSRPTEPSALSMRPRGKVRTGKLRLKEPMALIRPGPLTVGETWSEGRSFHCRYRRTGLTCRNRSGHGWWLGRRSGYRIF
jgi:hypothetical protein